jgi:hypothetical protein
VPGYFTKVEVPDPHLIGPVVWESLPPRDKVLVHERELSTSRDWAALDERSFRIDPESYRTEYSVTNIGRLRAARIADSRATQFSIRPPAVDAVWISIIERGMNRLVLPGSDDPAIGNPATGLISGREPGTQGLTGDGNSRLVLRLPGDFLRQRLEPLLDGKKVESIAFQPFFDHTPSTAALTLTAQCSN